jgi:hypothetical protein
MLHTSYVIKHITSQNFRNVFIKTCIVYDGLSHFIIPLTLDKTILKLEDPKGDKEGD